MIDSAVTAAIATRNGTDDTAAFVWHSDRPKDTALRAYVDCGTVAGAWRAAGLSRQTFYTWIESEADSPQRFSPSPI
jgi:hypothetical protein